MALPRRFRLLVATTTANRRTALLRWNNLISIPANATINSASILLNVTNNSAFAYPLYDVTRAWVEGANNGAAGTGASWTYYDAGTTAWGTAGAAGTTGSVDRGITNLWSSTGSFGGSPGVKTITLNADGLALVQGWVAGGTNNGVIIQDYTGHLRQPDLRLVGRDDSSRTKRQLLPPQQYGAKPADAGVAYALRRNGRQHLTNTGSHGQRYGWERNRCHVLRPGSGSRILDESGYGLRHCQQRKCDDGVAGSHDIDAV